MAQMTQVLVKDDVTGKDNLPEDRAKTFTVSVDGQTVEVDVEVGSTAHKWLMKAVNAGRPVRHNHTIRVGRRVRRAATGNRGRSDRAQTAKAREWTNQHRPGLLATRGRLPQTVWAAFEANNPNLLPQ